MGFTARHLLRWPWLQRTYNLSHPGVIGGGHAARLWPGPRRQPYSTGPAKPTDAGEPCAYSWQPCRMRRIPFRRCRPNWTASAGTAPPCCPARPRSDFYRGTGTSMGGYLAVADEIGAEVVVPVCASAPPSGPVEAMRAYEMFCRLITDAIAQGGFDAIWLDLHGAMVAEGFDDGEGELLSRIRALDPHTPLCVAYDMHANIFPANSH